VNLGISGAYEEIKAGLVLAQKSRLINGLGFRWRLVTKALGTWRFSPEQTASPVGSYSEHGNALVGEQGCLWWQAAS
jgi:hypothetical protein